MCSDMLLKLASGYNRVKTFVTGITSYLEIVPRKGVELLPIATHGLILRFKQLVARRSTCGTSYSLEFEESSSKFSDI